MNQQQAERCVYVMPTGRPGRYSMTNAKQRRIYDFIIAYQDANAGRSPSLDEIGAHVGIAAKSQVHGYVSYLQDLGWLTFVSHQTRSIRLTEPVMRFPRAV